MNSRGFLWEIESRGEVDFQVSLVLELEIASCNLSCALLKKLNLQGIVPVVSHLKIQDCLDSFWEGIY
jgi:hypothetical protein